MALIASLATAVMAAAGCDNSKEEDAVTPSIEISGITATDNSINFTVSVKDADKAAYMVKPSSEDAPEADAVIADGSAIKTDGQAEHIVYDLMPDTDYTIYAAARNGKISTLRTGTTRTTSRYDESFDGKEVLAIYYGNRDTRNKERYNYYLVISDVGFSPDMYVNPDGKFFFRIDLYYDRASDPDNAFIPAGTYGFDGLSDEPESGLIGNRSGFFQTDEMSFQKDKHSFENAELTVTDTENGQKLHFTATLDNGQVYELNYEGRLKFNNQSGESAGGKEDQLPPLEDDINTTFTYAEGLILAQQDDLSQVSLAFTDMEVSAEGLTPPGNILNVDIITVLQDGKLPERTYTLQNGDSDRNFLIPGYEEYEQGSYYPAFSYVMNYKTSNSSTTGYVTGGSVTVEKSAKGYRFTINLTTKDGHKVTGTYDGAFPLYGPGDSSLTDDYNISFPADTKLSAVYYGNYYSTNTANWLLVLMPESEKGDAFYMECFNADLDFSKGLAEGTYTPDNTGKSMTFLPGMINDNGQITYTYYAQVDGNSIYNYAPIAEGSIKVSRNGDTHTIEIDGVDDSGHKVTGKWTGTMTLTDNSDAASQSAMKKVAGPTRRSGGNARSLAHSRTIFHKIQ